MEIEGSREDASLLSRNIGQQMAGLLQPAGMVLDGHTHPASTLENVIALPPVRKTRRRRNGAASNSSADAPTIINFKHDPAKFGNPRQEWKTADKALPIHVKLFNCQTEIIGSAILGPGACGSS